jgi:PAS domain S-box-containing protein
VHIEAAGRQISFGGRNGALVVARDISGRRTSEAKVKAAEEKFRAAFQNAPTGMAIVDKAGMFLDVNAALARLFGRRVATLHGDLIWHHLHPEDSERVRGDFARVVEGTEDDVSGTFRYRTGAGGDGWVHASVSALVGQKSYIVHLVDVTQQKNTEYDLHRKATHDPLTGLPNRGLVLHKLGAALRSLRAEPGQVHVLFADLDGFKQVNDVHGHASETGCCARRRADARRAAAHRHDRPARRRRVRRDPQEPAARGAGRGDRAPAGPGGRPRRSRSRAASSTCGRASARPRPTTPTSRRPGCSAPRTRTCTRSSRRPGTPRATCPHRPPPLRAVK